MERTSSGCSCNILRLCFSQVETRTLEEVEEVLHYASETKTSLTRIMLDNMVVPLPNGDVDISMLKEAVRLVDGRFETEVFMTKFASFKMYHIIRIICWLNAPEYFGTAFIFFISIIFLLFLKRLMENSWVICNANCWIWLRMTLANNFLLTFLTNFCCHFFNARHPAMLLWIRYIKSGKVE